jgi:abortive infection bacteriophage resistance protein
MRHCGGCFFKGVIMKYSKPALSFQEQAKLLIARGLVVEHPQELVDYLRQVNYYRLSGYWYAYKVIDSTTGEEIFQPNTTFQRIRDLYEFDRKLRFLLMNGVERIEVAIFRTRLVETHVTRFGPFGYAVKKNYNPKFSPENFQKLMFDISEDEDRSYEEFIKRYRSKYSTEKYLPLWMVTDLMSFGQLLTFYRNQDLSIKQTISHQFNLFPMVLDSWLLTLNTIRNSCAHHTRLWNRPLPLIPKLPDKKHDSRWYIPYSVPDNRIFTVLTMIQYLLSFIAPTDPWKDSLEQLLVAYPTIPLRPMGIPINWLECPLWK